MAESFPWSDDFESGDFSAWTSTGGSPEVQNIIRFRGQSAKFDAVGEYCKVDMAESTEVWTRCWFYIHELPADWQTITGIRFYNSGAWIFDFEFDNDGGTTRLQINDNGPTSWSNATYAVPEKTWFCVIIKYICGAGGGFQVWVNADSKLTVNHDTSGWGNANEIVFGPVVSYSNGPLYLDNAAVKSRSMVCYGSSQSSHSSSSSSISSQSSSSSHSSSGSSSSSISSSFSSGSSSSSSDFSSSSSSSASSSISSSSESSSSNSSLSSSRSSSSESSSSESSSSSSESSTSSSESSSSSSESSSSSSASSSSSSESSSSSIAASALLILAKFYADELSWLFYVDEI